jgi:hypothetical protein
MKISDGYRQRLFFPAGFCALDSLHVLNYCIKRIDEDKTKGSDAVVVKGLDFSELVEALTAARSEIKELRRRSRVCDLYADILERKEIRCFDEFMRVYWEDRKDEKDWDLNEGGTTARGFVG